MRSYFERKKVMVIGDTGYNGGWLAAFLTELGAEVEGFSKDEPRGISAACSGRWNHTVGDVADLGKLRAEISRIRPDIIYNLAAVRSPQSAQISVMEAFATNLTGNLNLMECMREYPETAAVIVNGVNIYRKSKQAYGYDEEQPLGADDVISASMGSAELAVEGVSEQYQLLTATARLADTFGPGDCRDDSVVARIIAAIECGEPVRIQSEKKAFQVQHTLCAVHGLLSLGKRLHCEGYVGAYNIGAALFEQRDLRWIVDTIIQEMGRGFVEELPCEGEATDILMSDPPLTVNPKRAFGMLRFKPAWGLQEALTRTVALHCQNTDLKSAIRGEIEQYRKLARDI